MSSIQAALSSLYDSLNSLFFRMDNSNVQSVRVSRVMLRVGETKQAIGIGEVGDADTITAYELGGRTSTVIADDADAVDTLLTDIEMFLTSLTG